jgi:hypothetical protein
MKHYIAMVLVVILGSCKSAQQTVAVAEGKAESSLDAEKIIQGHYSNKKDFTTLYVKASAHYEDDKQSQNVTAEIRIKKDEKILVSIRFLGITMAKALITPTEVKYYEKLNSTYFEGNYAALSQWLGTELDFNKVQNLLLGQALDNLEKGKYKATVDDKLYKLEDISDKNTKKLFYFESENFLTKKEEISQPSEQRSLTVSYPNYTKYDKAILPAQLLLEAIQKKGKTNISIDYNSATFNEEISFPYSVPEGYERQNIN